MKDSHGLNFSPATVYRKRDSFAIHFYWRPNAFLPLERYRATFELNRIKDIYLRAQAAEVMAETVTEALKAGWNPETNEYPGGIDMAAPEAVKYYLPEALRSAHQSILKKSNKARTHSSYNSHLKLFIEYLEKKKRYKIAPDQFKALDAQAYIDSLLDQGYAPKTVNTKFDYAAGLFAWMYNTRIIPADPFAGIQRVPEPEKDEEDSLFTDQEIKRIKEHLYTKGAYPELWQYFLFIYYCYMRPDSIVAIKRKDVDLEARTVTVWPEDHKNSKKASKQILQAQYDYLAPYLESLQLDPEDYLFSKDMRPGRIKVAPTRAAEAWRANVKDPLKIYKNAYQGKHTGGTQYVEDNEGTENLKWLQMQMSHGNLQTTSIYVNKKKKVRLDESKATIKRI